MASNWSGVFNVVAEAKRHTDNFVTVRCVDNRRKDEKTYFTAKLYGKPGEWVEKCRAGEAVFFSGQPAIDEYNGNKNLVMWVNDVQFLPGKKKEVAEKKEEVTVPDDLADDSFGGDIPF